MVGCPERGPQEPKDPKERQGHWPTPPTGAAEHHKVKVVALGVALSLGAAEQHIRKKMVPHVPGTTKLPPSGASTGSSFPPTHHASTCSCTLICQPLSRAARPAHRATLPDLFDEPASQLAYPSVTIMHNLVPDEKEQSSLLYILRLQQATVSTRNLFRQRINPAFCSILSSSEGLPVATARHACLAATVMPVAKWTAPRPVLRREGPDQLTSSTRVLTRHHIVFC